MRAQGPTLFDCPQYPTYAFFERSCLIKTAYPAGEIQLPQAGVDGLSEERPMNISIPSNRPTWAIAIAHAWNYNRNIIQRVDHPKISYWMAITAHETGMACDCNAQWPTGRKPWHNNPGDYAVKCNEWITVMDGCFQMEEGNAWCGDLNQTWPWRFQKGKFTQNIGSSNFEIGALGLAYRNILNHSLIDYGWGVNIWPVITAAADPNAYEKLMASGWNSWAAAVQDNVSGTACCGQGFNLYTPAGRAAAIASPCWDLTATSNVYPEVVGWAMNVLENNTSSYYQYTNPIVTSIPGPSQNHVNFGYYNNNITWADVLQYLTTIYPFYPELTGAQTSAITAKVQAAFNAIAGGAAVPFKQLGPVVDEIILGLPKEDPLMSTLFNDGLPAYNNGYRQCIGKLAPASHISNQSGSDTVCKGQAVILEAIIDGGDGPNMTYTWYKDGIAVAGGNSKQLVVTPSAIGNFVYTVKVCNTDLGGCAQACCPKTLVVQNCNACSIVATATTVNTPCQNMFGGKINLNITGSANYTITYTSKDYSGTQTGTTSTTSINNVPDGVYNITIQDNSNPTCKFKLSAEVKFTTPMNEKLTASIQSMTACDAILKTKLEQDDCECEWSVYFDTPYAAWERDVFVIITPSNGASQRLRKDVLVNAYPAPVKTTFKLCTGESIKFEVEVQPSSGSCSGNAGYNQQNAPIEVYIKDPNGVKVLNKTIPIGSAQQYQNYLAFNYVVTCPYTPGNYTYVWNPSGVTGTPAHVAGLNPTTYTVTATNTANPQCSLSDTVFVPFHCNGCIVPHAVMSGKDTICQGDSTQLSVALTGVKPFKIKLSNGSTKWTVSNINTNTYTFYAKNAGTYKVDSVWDATCDTTGEGNAVLTVNALPTMSLGVDKSLCYGTKDSIKAPGSFASYLWTPGNQTTSAIFVDKAGQHILEVTDSKGCKTRDTVLVILDPEVFLSFPSDTVSICPGNTTTLKPSFSGGYGGFIPVWSGLGSGVKDTMLASAPGWYKLTLFDGRMCGKSDSVFVKYNALLNVQLRDTSICVGDTIQLSTNQNSTGNTFLWNTGATTPTIKVKNAGIYGVVVHNPSGCSGSDSMNLTLNALPVVNLGADKIICPGGSDSLKANKVFASYLWLPGNKTTASIFVNAAGQYILKATDTKGCKNSDTINVTLNSSININFCSDTVFICPGSSTVLKPIVTGGAGSFSYQWTGAASASADSVVATAQGWYKVRVTDSKLCINSDSIYVKENSSLVVKLSDSTICSGDSLTLFTAYSGTSYTYSWNTGATTSSIKVKNSGIFGVVIDNGSGCLGSDSMTLSLRTLPTVNLGLDKNICAGTSQVFNAGTFSSYLWSNNQTTSSITVNTSGNYSVKVTDNYGCVNRDTVALTVVKLPAPDTLKNMSICKSNNLLFDAGLYNNGNGPFTYLWNNGSIASSITLNNVSSNAVVFVDITDKYGCKGRDSATITILPNLPVVLSSNNDTVLCAGETIILSSNYAAPYHFLWSTGDTTQTISVGNSQTVTLTVNDGKGCTGSKAIQILVNPLPDMTKIPIQASICSGDEATIGFDFGNGYSYLWNNDATSATLKTKVGSTYSVKVTNKITGCFADTNVLVEVHANPTMTLGKDIDTCAGSVITLVSQPQNIGWTYNWSNNTHGNSLAVNNSGAYSLTVIDTFSCSAKDTINVNFRAFPVLNLVNGKDSVSICEGETQSLDAGYPGMKYLWNVSATTSKIVVNNTGMYSVKVSNGSCSVYDSVFVKEVVLPKNILSKVINSSPASICFEEDGALTLTVDSVSPAFTYLWNTDETTPSITVNKGGVYSVVLTEAHCAVSDQIKLIDYCPGSLFIPDAFTPNGDSHNNVFAAKGTNIKDFQMLIFNRWGEQIFSSNNISEGWDGTYQNRLVQQDVYVWKISYSLTSEVGITQKNERIGRVTVLY